MRDTVVMHERKAAFALLEAAEKSIDLEVLFAHQVVHELNEHIDEIEKETSDAIGELKVRLKRVDEVASVYGSQGTTNLTHLDDHANRGRAIVERWNAIATVVPQNSDITSRAFTRVNQAKTPARKGKDSMKDCVVIETYLEVVSELRSANLTTPIVFVSSNVKDFTGTNRTILKPDLGTDFLNLGLGYAPNMAAAKHLLGL